MNKVISIHLHGVAFQLEEGGYDSLRTYLDNAARQLDGNPDKTEIMADIEQAIADKFAGRLTAGRNVVLTAEVEAVIGEIGPVTGDPGEAENDKTAPKPGAGPESTTSSSSPQPSPSKRLYRIKEGAMVSGVCNGLAAYLGIDVTLLRLVVAILIFFSFGTVAIAYLVGIIIIPKAVTPEQKTEATGGSQTAHDFVRMAREGYYEGMKSFPDRQTRREWKKKFKHDMKCWRSNFHWQQWTPPHAQSPGSPPPAPEAYSMAPTLLTMLKALLNLFLWFVIFSLIATRGVFGVPLPWGLPFWAGIVLAIIAYNIVVEPIKMLRRSYYYRQYGHAYCWNPFAAIWHTLLTLCILAFFIFLADRFFPGFHQALMTLPEFLHNVAANIQQWWNGR